MTSQNEWWFIIHHVWPSLRTIHPCIMIDIALTISFLKTTFSKFMSSLYKPIVLSYAAYFGLTTFTIHNRTLCERKKPKLQVCLWCCNTRVKVYCNVFFSDIKCLKNPLQIQVCKLLQIVWYPRNNSKNSVCFCQFIYP